MIQEDKLLRETAREKVAQMTLEEKASLCSGANFWQSKAVERVGVPAFMLTDGPHGLRKQSGSSDHLGINASVPSTCFPPAAATACCYDTALLQEMGTAMGQECVAESVGVILGPAANIKRSPLCGRNFEYFSEDPLLSGEASAALISGIQSQNVGTSMKHFLANNQEKARVSSNSVLDERALREIYLAAFEIAVKKAQPWTLMCSYNKINDIYASDNKRLMTDIPRGEWGYEGAILTDWGAMNDRVQAIIAGLDLEMPGPCLGNDAKIVKAVREGRLSESAVDKCAQRMSYIALRTAQNTPAPYDIDAHNDLARRIARESAVLLRKGGALPLKATADLAIIGDFAKTPRYQGAGSSKINPHKITSLCDALDSRGISYTYSAGFDAEGEVDEAKIAAAVEAAKAASVAVIMLGLPDSYESEGFDRTHMDLPQSQNRLMEELSKTDTALVVVISTGSAVCLPWKDKTDSILLAYLPGQNGGNAILDLLLGDESPCGKLPETWPLSIADTPCYGYFGSSGNVEYRESIYVGYRYYDKAQKDVAYPFGHGLSYTEFEYSNMQLSSAEIGASDELSVSVTIKNTGTLAGKEVVQIYVAPPQNGIHRPLRELRAYTKVALAAGESKTCTLKLSPRAFSWYDVESSDWCIDSGTYIIEAASSSRDIRVSQKLAVKASEPKKLYANEAPAYYNPSASWPVPAAQFEAVLGHKLPAERSVRPFTVNSTLGEVQATMIGRSFVKQIRKNLSSQMGGGDNNEIMTMIDAMILDMPIRQLAMMSGGALTENVMQGLVDMMNKHFIKGIKNLTTKA